MTAAEFHKTILSPALDQIGKFAPKLTRSRSLEVLMLATAGQESHWTERVQIPSGMAHGFFQQQLNDIEDIIKNPATSLLFKMGTKAYLLGNVTAQQVFDLLAHPAGDFFSVFMARLNYWANPTPIPPYDETEGQYQYYLDTWRPGAPSRKRWEEVHSEAMQAVP